MWNKILTILESVRFWQLALIAAIQVAMGVGLIDGATAVVWAHGVQLLLGGSVTLGTLDSVGQSIAGTKRPQ